ncbi:hypothetical protein Tco_0676859, partial [Tanacetum coccineum]
IQALVDGKKVIITEASIRRDLQLVDKNGTDCLPNATIFAELERMGAKTTAWNEFSSTMASAVICLATNQKFNFSKYIFDNMVKNVDSMVKFLMYPRFVQVVLDKQVGNMSTHNKTYDAPCHTKKVFANMKRQGKDFFGRITPLFPTMMVQAQEEVGEEPIPDEAANEEHVPTHFYDPPQSGEDRLQLNELMELCTTLQQRVLDLENTKTTQALEIESLKKRVGLLRRIESSKDEGLGEQEDASKQGRSIADINQDAKVTLVDETQGRNDDNLMFDTSVLDKEEVEVEKAVTTAATTTITAKVRGVIVQEPSEFTTTTSPSQPSQLPQKSKDKSKAKMIEPEVPLKKKDQIRADKELALNLQAQLQAELEQEERLAR